LKIQYFSSPIPHIIIENCFSKKINKKIIKESIKLKTKFVDASIGHNTIDKTMRSNKVCYYHDVYPNEPKIRKSSPLLSSLNSLFANGDFRHLLSSSPSPLSEFVMTNRDEIQVSRYGDNSQKYDWHIDRFENMERHITMVYYFNKEPKKYKGGELLLSSSPLYKHQLVGTNPKIKEITPENNMLVVFPSNVAHCVKSTTSPNPFEDGRFSANIWLGFNRR